LPVQLTGPMPNVVWLHLAQAHRQRSGQALQAHEGVAVDRERSLGEAPLDLQVNKVTREVVVQLGSSGGHG